MDYKADKDIDLMHIKKILGSSYDHMSDEQITNIISKTRELVNIFLDIYERNTFNGKTLQEIKCKSDII